MTDMKRVFGLVLIFLIIIIKIGILVTAHYSWSGDLKIGDKLTVNDEYVLVFDVSAENNQTYVIAYKSGSVAGVFKIEMETAKIDYMTIAAGSRKPDNTITVYITSEKPLSVIIGEPGANVAEIEKLKAKISKLQNDINNLNNEIKKLQDENRKLKNENQKLKDENAKLREKLKVANVKDYQSLKLKVANLTKENRILKEQLANQTKQIKALENALKAANEELERHKEFFAKIIRDKAVLAMTNYVKEAEKEKTWGSRIIKALIVASFFTIAAGFAVAKIKHRHDSFGF